MAGGDLAVSAPGGVMSVNIASGIAHVYGFFYRNDASLATTIAAADPSLPRIDRIIVRMDFVGRTVQSAVLQGTPNASPVAPTLTQTSTTFELSLAQVRVNAAVTQILAANVTDERTYEAPAIGAGSIPLADLASGALPAANTVPAPQVTSGLLGTGVQLPGGANLPGGKLGISADGDLLDGSGTTTVLKSRGTGVNLADNVGNTLLRVPGDGTVVFRTPGNFFYGISTFSGGGIGTFSHGLGITPTYVGVTPSVNGSATIGADTLGSTTAHITVGSGFGFIAMATRTA